MGNYLKRECLEERPLAPPSVWGGKDLHEILGACGQTADVESGLNGKNTFLLGKPGSNSFLSYSKTVTNLVRGDVERHPPRPSVVHLKEKDK